MGYKAKATPMPAARPARSYSEEQAAGSTAVNDPKAGERFAEITTAGCPKSVVIGQTVLSPHKPGQNLRMESGVFYV
jgi:hypothetical protein